MNFRDLAIMNDAFLLKQFLRILDKHSSPIIRVLKAKYFRNTNILSTLQPTSSPKWKGIWKTGMEVKNWIVFNQNMEPKWLGDSCGLFSVKSAYKVLKQVSDAKLMEGI